MTRYEQMLARFKEYDQQNPNVWKLFVKFTNQLIGKGYKNHSAVAVIQRIRWETSVIDGDVIKEWKINNDHIPFYARKFMLFNPVHNGFFRTREQKSQGKPAVELPPLTPEDFPYTNDKLQFKLNL